MPASQPFIHHTVEDSLPHGAEAKVTRAFYRDGSGYGAHDHDFPEVFWIEEGTAVHVVGSGQGEREELPAGTVVFVRPDDVHAFATPPGRDFTVVNVVLSPASLARAAATYAPCVPLWPWPASSTTTRPLHRRLDPPGLAAAQAWADVLARQPDRLAFDGLILTLLRATVVPREEAAVPVWLRQAITAFGAGDQLAAGVAGLARLAGRGTAHLNRCVRRHYGMTATALVTRLRLEQAGRRLGMSDDPIVDIALACGFESLSYFYRVFRRRYGRTPHAFRAQYQSQPRIGWG